MYSPCTGQVWHALVVELRPHFGAPPPPHLDLQAALLLLLLLQWADIPLGWTATVGLIYGTVLLLRLLLLH